MRSRMTAHMVWNGLPARSLTGRMPVPRGAIVAITVFRLCVAVFLGALFLTARMKKAFADRMSSLPLDDGERTAKGVPHE